METNDYNQEPDYEARPLYSENDRVIHIRPGMKFSGKIHRVVPPDQMNDCLDQLREMKGLDEVEEALSYYQERDPNCLKNAVYVIVPDGYRDPATWEQAQLIVPSLTRDQYDRIMGSRFFIVLESDLIPEEWEENA